MDPLRVADSFRVRWCAGRAEVRGFSRHLARFRATVNAAAQDPAGPDGPSAAELDRFLTSACDQIVDFGTGNPRLELRADGTLGLLLRPLPPLTDELVVRAATIADLTHPERKGPNIGRFGALNQALGAEAMRVDAAGLVVEGTTTAILWWSGRTLCASASTDRVQSVTEALILAAASRLGYATARLRIAASDLGAHEAWAVNALHGIRPISAIDGAAAPPVDRARLALFREELDQTWEPVLRG